MPVEVPLTKYCGICSTTKAAADFNRCARHPSGLQTTCRACARAYRLAEKEHRREYSRQYRQENRERACGYSAKYRSLNLKKVRQSASEYARRVRKERPDHIHERDRRSALSKQYGITIAEYDRLFAMQGGVCAVCGTKDARTKRGYLCVDHDHKTGDVRGLLCNNCNSALGQVRDSTHVLQRLIAYLNGTLNFPDLRSAA